MDPHTHLDALTEGVPRLREVLADGDLAAPVSGCPGWTLADLGAHVGSIYRFARTGLVERRGLDVKEPGPTEREPMLAWFDEGADALLAALRSIDARDGWDAPAWTMAPPATAAFWARRQHHETALHLWDALESQGADPAAAAALALADDSAADGIDEIVRMFFPRQVRLGRLAPLQDSLGVIAGPVSLVIGGDGTGDPHLDSRSHAVASEAPDAVLAGPPAAVLLALWKRIPLDSPGLTITGDLAAASRVVSAALTP
ncbi:maleylpyruvate isomerase N-terminal domain-containing protein [Cnuibacter sp. UC19_7]|uniref:maleylpyruvate isomerase N-terminal domain-containing protein n=1 Tax=Cnuibacter sp. UC19_7 TaxID=3350166 RepID=UPI00366F81EB